MASKGIIMLFITVQDVRINIAHIAHYVQRRDGVLVTFVQGNDLMVVHAKCDEFDKALNRHGESMAILAAAGRAIR